MSFDLVRGELRFRRHLGARNGGGSDLRQFMVLHLEEGAVSRVEGLRKPRQHPIGEAFKANGFDHFGEANRNPRDRALPSLGSKP